MTFFLKMNLVGFLHGVQPELASHIGQTISIGHYHARGLAGYFDYHLAIHTSSRKQ